MQLKIDRLKIAACSWLLIVGACASASAAGVSPYLPLHLSPEIERDVERVLILGERSAMTRPIPAAQVLEALPKACARDEALCKRVRNFLERYMHRVGVTDAGIEASASNNVAHPLANQHGLDSNSHWQAGAQGYWQPNDFLLFSASVMARQGNALLGENSTAVVPDESVVSMGFDFAQFDIGYRDHWLSPMTDSSMLMGAQAKTMPSITLSNYRPLGPLGLQYELFLARMSASSNIVYQNRLTSGNPRLAGLHLAIEPQPGWSLAANRLMQYGGGERGGTSGRDFLHALFKPHEYDNTSASLTSDQQFGNQQASWTSRIVFPGATPFSAYFEYAGEDSSYSGNYRLGNAALSAGIDFPKLWKNFDLTYEASEWQNGWYVHGVYGDGLTNHGHVIGHWFGDNRVFNDGVGGQSHMLRLGWQPVFGGVAQLRYRTLQNASYTNQNYERAHDLALSYSYPLKTFLVGGEINVGRDVFGERYSRLAAYARFGAEFSGDGRSLDGDSSDSDAGVQYFVDAGGAAARVRVELADGSPKYITPTAYAPHLGFGARRAISDASDLGVRLEIDRMHYNDAQDALLLAVRALDYRHRFGEHFAVTAFAGAARFHLATPAFGYYGGAGAQWRDLARRLDLNFDLRYGDKLARDKLLPTDPSSDPRPDMFFDLMGATLYLSYRL